MITLTLVLLALIWMLFAIVQDIRRREISDWVNFSLIIFALGFRFFYSLFEAENFSFFYQGLIGFGIFVGLGNLLYYSRMFAGGDAKLFMALGAILPFSEKFLVNLELFILFFVLFLFAGAIYSITASVFLGIRNFKNFKKEFGMQFKKNKKIICAVMFLGLIIMAFGLSETLFFVFGILIFVLPYLYLYLKSVDEACMVEKVSATKLEEGDWLYKDVKIGRKIIKATWGGLSRKDIEYLKKKKKSVVIRKGIPFSPVFLIAFLIYVYLWKIGLWNSLW